GRIERQPPAARIAVALPEESQLASGCPRRRGREILRARAGKFVEVYGSRHHFGNYAIEEERDQTFAVNTGTMLTCRVPDNQLSSSERQAGYRTRDARQSVRSAMLE